MDMRGQPERRFAVHLEHLEHFSFESQAYEDDRLHGEPYRSDEPDPVGDASGPSTPALLGSAIGHCLSNALMETLRAAHLDVRGLETEAVAVVRPNDEGNPRIDHVDVTIRPRLGEESGRSQRCADIFQNYCTVASSVKRGIDVRVNVEFSVESEAPGPAL